MSEKRCPKCGGTGSIPRFRSPKNGQIIMWKQCPDCQGGGVDIKPTSAQGKKK